MKDNLMHCKFTTFSVKRTPIFGSEVVLHQSGNEYQLVVNGRPVMKREAAKGSCWVALEVLGYPIDELRYLFSATKKADKYLDYSTG